MNGNVKGDFTIYDIQGKLMLTETMAEPNQTIYISGLNPGIYIFGNGKLER